MAAIQGRIAPLNKGFGRHRLFGGDYVYLVKLNPKIMKKVLPLFLLAISFSSCWTRLGDLSMVSNRNVDRNVEYVELQRYVKAKSNGGGTSYTKSYDVTSDNMNYNKQNVGALEKAIDNCVRSVQGGEFLKNVQIEISGNGNRVRLVADVWGISGVMTEKEKTQSKFNIGDNVTWSNFGTFLKGTITGKDDEKAVVKYYDNKGAEVITKVAYDKLTVIYEEIVVPNKNTNTDNNSNTNSENNNSNTNTENNNSNVTNNTTGFVVGQIVDFDDVFNGWMEGKITYIAPDNMITVEYKTSQGLLKTKKVSPAKVKARK